MNSPAANTPKLALHTLGCRLNQSETATLAASFARRGFQLVPFGEPADLLVINSCSVTATSEAECRQLVRRVLRQHPRTFVAVTGCYAQRSSESLLQIPGIDLVVGSEDKMRLADLIPGGSLQKRRVPRVVKSRRSRGTFRHDEAGLYMGQTRANLKIQDGCDVGCSFCIIPRTRGRARSRDGNDVLREARLLLEAGHRELVLTGVNLGSYEQEPRDFAALLGELAALQGLERLRIGSIEPTTLTPAVLRLVATHPRICKHLHVPAQSGDDAILAAMHRPYGRRVLDRLFARIHAEIPDVGLGTDLMVGFPGEDDEAFRATLDLATRSGFAYLHVFRYSPRPGTAAARLGAVAATASHARSQRLRQIDRRLRLAFGRRFLTRDLAVLFESRGPDGTWTGLTHNYLRVSTQAPHLDLQNRLHLVRLEDRRGGSWIGSLAD